MTMQTFRVEVPEGDLADLRERPARTRWAPPSPAPDWVQGTPVEYLRELVDYWAGPYDWRSPRAADVVDGARSRRRNVIG